jgi:hypothetical protein
MDASSPMHVASLASVALTPNTTFTYRRWLILGDQPSRTSRVEELITRHSEK